MKHKVTCRNARKILAGVLVTVQILGGVPVYAVEQGTVQITEAEFEEESVIAEETEFDQSEVQEPDSVGEEGASEEQNDSEESDKISEEQNDSGESDKIPEEQNDSEESDKIPEEQDDSDENEEVAETSNDDISDENEVTNEEKSEKEEGTSDEEMPEADSLEGENASGDDDEVLPGVEEDILSTDEEIMSVNDMEPILSEEYEAETLADNENLAASNNWVLDLSDFNASGEDKNADDKVIQSLLDRARLEEIPAGKQLTVKIPKGTWYLDDCLKIYSNTSLELAPDAIMVRNNLGGIMLQNAHWKDGDRSRICDPNYAGGECSHGGYSQGENISVSGGIWDGNVGNNTSTSMEAMFTLLHAKNITIKDTVLQNSSGEHMLVLNGMKDIRIEGVTFKDCKRYTGNDEKYYSTQDKKDTYTAYEESELVEFKEAVHIDATNPVGTSTYPQDDTFCENITVKDCKFENVLAGVGGHHGGKELPASRTHNNIIIEGNTFKNLKGIAVVGFRFKDAEIKNNTADNVFIFVDASEGVASLSGNKVKNITSTAVYITDSSALKLENESYEMASSVISDSFIIDVLENSSCTVKNSTLLNGKRGGIGARKNSNITVDNVIIQSNSKEWGEKKYSPVGIYVSESDGNLTANTITGTKGSTYGIYVNQNKNQTVTILNNSIKQCDLGIALENVQGTVNITGSDGKSLISECNIGIQLLDAKGDIRIKENIIKNTTSHGILLMSSRASIDGNMISAAEGKSSGIRITLNGSGTKLTDSMVIENNKIDGIYYGISAHKEQNIVIKGNTVSKCKEEGIRVTESGKIKVTGNKVTGTVKGSDITFWNCTSGECSGNTVTENVSKNILQTNTNKVTIGTNFVEGQSSATGVWKKEGGKYYFYKDGKKQTGWQEDRGKWYYMDSKGVMQTGWVKDKGSWYYMSGDGAMQKDWQKIKGSWYYMDGSGVMKTGWQKIKGAWYYMDGSGAMKTGWQKIKGSWYYMDGSGVMKTGWQKIKGSWYYMNGSGVMQTGWEKLGGKWYYFESSGVMVTGRKVIGGKTYNFSSDGVLK